MSIHSRTPRSTNPSLRRDERWARRECSSNRTSIRSCAAARSMKPLWVAQKKQKTGVGVGAQKQEKKLAGWNKTRVLAPLKAPFARLFPRVHASVTLTLIFPPRKRVTDRLQALASLINISGWVFPSVCVAWNSLIMEARNNGKSCGKIRRLTLASFFSSKARKYIAYVFTSRWKLAWKISFRARLTPQITSALVRTARNDSARGDSKF